MSSLQFLSIFSNNISGTLRGSLCNINSKLELLNLGRNELYGQISPNLYKCKRLRLIGLDSNKFTGNIPKEFGNFTQIEVLYLGTNNFTGEIPKEITELVSLQNLGIEKNSLHGSIPKTIGNLTSLRDLYMSDNYLEGTLPPEMFRNLNNLQILTLSGNRIGGPIPFGIFNLSTLEYIELGSNQLSGHLPSSMGHLLPNLKGLYLGQNKLSGSIPNSICNASQLIDLDLGGNLFSGFIPDSLGNLRNLRRLSMVDNLLTSKHTSPNLSFLSSLRNCKNLVLLGFGGNPLDIHLPKSVGNLSSSLQKIWLHNCQMKGTIPAELGNLSSLILLNLQDNELTGVIPVTIRKLQLLQLLALQGNKLQGYIPEEICYLHRLYTLYLQSNELSGSMPKCWSNLTSLRQLDLSSNRLTSIIPSAFWEQPYILTINLSLNSLSGSVPLEIESLKVAVSLDVSRNRLSGKIPPTIGNLKDLTYLSLSDNRFQGPIPQPFGDLGSLETLDLSTNNLSGVIPKSLEKLLYLKHFNVSFNQLHGEIPDRGPFRNFSAESFMGNEALCGSPRLQFSPCKNDNIIQSKTHDMHVFRYIISVIASIVMALAFVIVLVRYLGRKPEVAQQGLLPSATWRRISYRELELATDGFAECSLLGSGSFGSVYRGTLSDGMAIAVKVFKLQSDGAFSSFDTECEILRNLRHRNLVKIISSCSTPDFKALVFDFMPNGSLEKWLYSYNYFLNLLQRLDIMIDVASALEYLHCGYATPAVHCDLKPSNVLLDEDMVAHVGDFGISKLLGEGESMTHTLTLATIGYMAPEFGLEGTVSVKGDAYSFGVLMMETFTRKKPTDEIFEGEMSLKNWVKQSLPDAITQVVDPNLLRREEQHFSGKQDCVKSILEMDLECCADSPEDRPDMKDVVTALKKIKTRFLKAVERSQPR